MLPTSCVDDWLFPKKKYWQEVCGEAASWTFSEQLLETRLTFKGWLHLGPLCRQCECFIASSQSSLPCYLSLPAYLSLPFLSPSFFLTLPVFYPLLPAHSSLIPSLSLSSPLSFSAFPICPSTPSLPPSPSFLPLTYTHFLTSFHISPSLFQHFYHLVSLTPIFFLSLPPTLLTPLSPTPPH